MAVKFARAKAIFLDAIEIESPAERAAFLDLSCAGDEALRRRVEALLAAHDRPAHLLGRHDQSRVGPPGLNAAAATVIIAEPPGTLVGAYTLGEVLGEGGMGLVYRAFQDFPVRRSVALKIVKPGMDTRQVIARFQAERQALALMNHPNIARVIDAGATVQGRPYFVMELVDGQPITAYCDDHRLTVRERVELFATVCRAVQHAHQKGIIHRDLKPSNVLVTEIDGAAVPKVIDFGVAKAIGEGVAEHTALTGVAQLVGTPLYMSPEQANLGSVDIDTRSDVYSLGVLLYELLTGSTPVGRTRLKDTSYETIKRVLQHEDPPTPSTRIGSSSAEAERIASSRRTELRTLEKEVRGELDWIVMKCLEKERNRRYETANAVAADLQRHLDGKQVEAAPPRRGYRLRKTIQRHRVFLTTVSLVGLALVAGTVVSTWLAIRAIRAEGKTAEALKIADRHLYAARIHLVQDALDDGQVERSQEMLDEFKPAPGSADQRDFAWHYLRGLARREIVQYPSQSSPVWRLLLFDGGQLLAHGTVGGEIYIVDLNSEKVLFRLEGHTGPMNDLEVSKDGRWLFSAVDDATKPTGQVQIWDLKAKRRVGSAEMPAGYRAHHIWLLKSDRLLSVWVVPTQEGQPNRLISFEVGTDPAHPRPLVSQVLNGSFQLTPDGRAFVELRSGDIQEIDLLSGETLRVLPVETEPANLRFLSPGSRKLVKVTAGPANEAIQIDLASGTEEARLPLGGMTLHRVLESDDFRTFVLIGQSQEVLIWRRDSGTSRRIMPEGLGRENGSLIAAISPDGRLLALSTWGIPGGQMPLRVHDTATGEIVATYPGRLAQIGQVLFAPDGRSMYIGSGHAVKRWWLEPRRPVELDGHKAEAWSLAFSPEGKYLLSGSDDVGEDQTFKVWDLATGDYLSAGHPLEATVSAMALSPDGKRLATAALTSDQNLKLWDTTDLTDVNRWELVRNLDGHDDKVRTAAFSPDGRTLASAGADRAIRLWDGVTGERLGVLEGHEDGVRQVAFSPDGEWLASASNDRTVRIWRLASRQCVATHRGPAPFTSVAFSPAGGLLAAANQQGLITCLDPSTGRVLSRIYSEDSEARTLAFSPDGRILAAAGMGKVVRIWDVMTGQELLTLEGHTTQINALAFSPDGQSLASAAHSGEVKLWTGERRDVRRLPVLD